MRATTARNVPAVCRAFREMFANELFRQLNPFITFIPFGSWFFLFTWTGQCTESSDRYRCSSSSASAAADQRQAQSAKLIHPS
jgi:hypothetical protein